MVLVDNLELDSGLSSFTDEACLFVFKPLPRSDWLGFLAQVDADLVDRQFKQIRFITESDHIKVIGGGVDTDAQQATVDRLLLGHKAMIWCELVLEDGGIFLALEKLLLERQPLH